MSETATAPAEAAPVTEATPPPAEATEAPSTRANGATISDADLAAIDASAEPGAAPTTIKIGDHEIPISALADLPDEALAHIKRKIKANGEEVEISLADALGEVPLARGAQRKMQEAAKMRRQLEEAAELLGEDPVAAYARIHRVSRDEAADMVATKLMADIERMSMTPEDRAEHDRRAELERKAKLAEQYEEAERARTFEARVESLRSSYAASTRTALEGAGLAPTPYNVQRLASILQPLVEAERLPEEVPAEAFAWAAQQVTKERAAERSETFGTLEGDALLEALGEDVARKAARAYAQRVRRSQTAVRAPEGTKTPGERRRDATDELRSMTWAEWKQAQNRNMGGR